MIFKADGRNRTADPHITNLILIKLT